MAGRQVCLSGHELNERPAMLDGFDPVMRWAFRYPLRRILFDIVCNEKEREIVTQRRYRNEKSSLDRAVRVAQGG